MQRTSQSMPVVKQPTDETTFVCPDSNRALTQRSPPPAPLPSHVPPSRRSPIRSLHLMRTSRRRPHEPDAITRDFLREKGVEVSDAEIARYKQRLSENLIEPNNFELWVMNADGTNPVRLTNDC